MPSIRHSRRPVGLPSNSTFVPAPLATAVIQNFGTVASSWARCAHFPSRSHCGSFGSHPPCAQSFDTVVSRIEHGVTQHHGACGTDSCDTPYPDQILQHKRSSVPVLAFRSYGPFPATLTICL